MSYESLDDSVTISRMAYALRGYEFIESPFIRASAYVAAAVAASDIRLYDRRALFTEQMRRKVFGVAGASVIAMAPFTAAYAGEGAAEALSWFAVVERLFAGFGVVAFLAVVAFAVLCALDMRINDHGRTADADVPTGDGDNIPHLMETHQ